MAFGSGITATCESLKRDILQRLHDQLVHILERQPLDIEGWTGGIDGYSRKPATQGVPCLCYLIGRYLYLKVADNSRSDSHLAFSEAVNKHGFPTESERIMEEKMWE